MILEYKNNNGFIYAYITWNIIDDDNKLVNDGPIVAISGTWVHPGLRNKGVLKLMIQDLFDHPTTQKSEYVLSYREKYKGRPAIKKPIYRYLKYITGGKDGQRKTNKSNRKKSNSNS